MTIKTTSVAFLLMMSLSPAPVLADASDRQGKRLSISELSTFKLKPAVLQQRLDQALMQNPNSVPLNFLRGLIYDSSSAMGSEGRQLARVGYLAALRTDPTYWPANYQLGLLAMDDGDSISAERSFIAAAAYADDEPQVFYALARASYCSGNLGTAKLALERAVALKAPDRDEELVTAALVQHLPETALGHSAGSARLAMPQRARQAGICRHEFPNSPALTSAMKAILGPNLRSRLHQNGRWQRLMSLLSEGKKPKQRPAVSI